MAAATRSATVFSGDIITCTAPTLPWIVTFNRSFVSFFGLAPGDRLATLRSWSKSGNVFGLLSCFSVCIAAGSLPWNDDDFSDNFPLRLGSCPLRLLFEFGIKYLNNLSIKQKIKANSFLFLYFHFCWFRYYRLPQSPITEVPEAWETESWRGA